MKELLVGLAEYNQNADRKMMSILDGCPAQALTKDMGSYYKTILATVEHMYVAEASWLKRYNDFFTYPSLSRSWLASADMDEIRKKAASGAKALFPLLEGADTLLVSFANELKEGDLETRVRFKTLRGEEMQRRYWNTIVHILNHQTHHRGEISAMLDMQGVANDYSGFNGYTK